MALTEEEKLKYDEAFGLSPVSSTQKNAQSRIDDLHRKAALYDQQKEETRKVEADAESADEYNALVPSKTDQSPVVAGLKATANVPSSVYSLIKNIGSAVLHPINTAKGVKRTVAGAAQTGRRKLHDALGVQTESDEKPETLDEKTFGAVVDAVKERYGSLEAAERTATNDPFGFGADVISIMAGGVGLARKIPGAAKVAELVKPVTAPISGVRDAALEGTAGMLKKSAAKNIESVLAPTKESMKSLTRQVLPELVNRKKVAFTRKGLQDQVAQELEDAGQMIDVELSKIPPQTQVEIQPIIEAIENTKNSFKVKGTEVVAEPDAWRAADELQQVIIDVAKDGDSVPFESLRSLRQIWDESIAKSKGFTKQLSDQDKLSIKREATNAIRRELSKEFPNLDIVNKEYSLWSKVEDILEETVKRKTGQSGGLSKKIMTGAGATAGGSALGLKGIALGAGVVTALVTLFRSTLWKTLSAATKSKIADLIMKGDGTAIQKVVGPILESQTLELVNEPKEEEDSSLLPI